MDCNTPGFPVLHRLPEFAKTHVHGVGDGIQPSHSRLPPSPPALNLSQQQGLLFAVSVKWGQLRCFLTGCRRKEQNEYTRLTVSVQLSAIPMPITPLALLLLLQSTLWPGGSALGFRKLPCHLTPPGLCMWDTAPALLTQLLGETLPRKQGHSPRGSRAALHLGKMRPSFQSPLPRPPPRPSDSALMKITQQRGLGEN